MKISGGFANWLSIGKICRLLEKNLQELFTSLKFSPH
jgi:hypothetical protein